MKVEEIFDKVAPMVEQLELDQDTALLMLGTDKEKKLRSHQRKW